MIKSMRKKKRKLFEFEGPMEDFGQEERLKLL
jgi:hypothetical protein